MFGLVLSLYTGIANAAPAFNELKGKLETDAKLHLFRRPFG